MHEAFVVTPVLKKLPAGLYIETLAAFGDYFVVGTKSGNLLYYQLTSRLQGDASQQVNGEYEVNLLSTNKSFSKKIITQIEVVPEFQMLLCLADNSVNVFILDDTYINFVTTVSKSKGAQLFAVNIVMHKSMDNKLVPSLHLCVVIKKKLLFYYWKPKGSKFLNLEQDVTLPDTPRTIVWCENSLFIGYKTEYRLLEVPTGISKDLFSTGGKQQEPLVTLIAGNRIAAGMDDQTVIIDSDGNPALKYLIKWSDVPLSLAYDSPYLIAVLPLSLEVCSIEPRLHVQSIGLKNVKMISSSKSGWVFVASHNELWLLRSVPFPDQISKLREQNELALALCMAKMVSDDELQKSIQNLHAFSLFRKREFREAMDMFLELGTDPCHVIGLFPDLLPEEFRHQLKYPDELPRLKGLEIENGLFALATYLVQVRNNLLKVVEDVDGTTQSSSIAIEIGLNTVRSKNQLLQIIDTTLLKSYLLSNEALASSLLRQRNYCHVEESERALKEHHKYNDLILLYNGKGDHDKALKLMRNEAKKPDSPLKGHDRTVKYLQQLEREHLKLVFIYAEWVLKDYPEDGLKIFIDECIEKDHFPRIEVHLYLQNKFPDLVIPYLEHVIHVWKEELPMLHNSLISKYREKICSLREEYEIALPEGEPLAKPGEETEELQELHSKLIQFLENSQHYTVETFAMLLQHDRLFEAAAVVLGRLSRHREALYIYIHSLQDIEKAKLYCSRHYNKDNSSDRDVYLLLVKLFLCMPDIYELCPPSSCTMNSSTPPHHNLELALETLEKYSSFIDPFEVINILPSDVPVSKIRDFLKSVLHNFQTEKHKMKLMKSLISTENLDVRHQIIRYQSFKLVVSDLDLCRVCQKRIGKGAFAYFPNGIYVHYSCKDHYINVDGKF